MRGDDAAFSVCPGVSGPGLGWLRVAFLRLLRVSSGTQDGLANFVKVNIHRLIWYFPFANYKSNFERI